MNFIKTFFRWVDMYRWRALISFLVIAFSVILVTEPFWFIAAIDSLRVVYAVFLVVFILFFFFRNVFALTTAGGIALVILIPGIWKYFNLANVNASEEKKENTSVPAADFTVLHFNVKENNKHIISVAEAALKADADIVSMQELNEVSLQTIDTILRKKYPYVLSDISIKGFGMAVYSKYPIQQQEVRIEHDFPMLNGVISINGKGLEFIAATTSTPTNDKDYEKQMKQFKFIASFADSLPEPLIVMGDMNAVPWSEQVKSLLASTKLRDSRKDLSGTYPAQSPLQIPIDYIFHSKTLVCEQFTTVGGTTSNHMGILGYYSFDNGKNKKKINELIR